MDALNSVAHVDKPTYTHRWRWRIKGPAGRREEGSWKDEKDKQDMQDEQEACTLGGNANFGPGCPHPDPPPHPPLRHTRSKRRVMQAAFRQTHTHTHSSEDVVSVCVFHADAELER